MNIAEIEMQLSDLVNEPFDRSEFVFQFIEPLGVGVKWAHFVAND